MQTIRNILIISVLYLFFPVVLLLFAVFFIMLFSAPGIDYSDIMQMAATKVTFLCAWAVYSIVLGVAQAQELI